MRVGIHSVEDVIGCKTADSCPKSTSLPNSQLVKCLMCQKDFDRKDEATDPINLFCRLCKSSLASFPKFGRTRIINSSQTEPNSSNSPIEVEKEKETAQQIVPLDVDSGDENAAELSEDEDKDSLETLPTYEDIYQQDEISGYTGFQDAKQLGSHFAAAKLAESDTSISLVIGNLNSLVFKQSRDPNNFAISGKQSFWKLVGDPYTRSSSLIMYGYDLYDAWQFKEVAIVSYCMIMGTKGPLGYILFKMGRTRCASPRVDGFIYDIREDK